MEDMENEYKLHWTKVGVANNWLSETILKWITRIMYHLKVKIKLSSIVLRDYR